MAAGTALRTRGIVMPSRVRAMRFVMQILYPIDSQTAALCCDVNHCTCSPQVGYTAIVAALVTFSQLSYASATRRRISPNQRRRKQYALVSHDGRSCSRSFAYHDRSAGFILCPGRWRLDGFPRQEQLQRRRSRPGALCRTCLTGTYAWHGPGKGTPSLPLPQPAVALNVLFAPNSDTLPATSYAEVDKLGTVLSWPQYTDYRSSLQDTRTTRALNARTGALRTAGPEY